VFNGESQRVSFGSTEGRPSKLHYLNAAANLGTQGATRQPARDFEADRAGQHSIRINDQFRICFVWTPEGPVAVEITDYH
jgi:proteic killer suppression protein